MVVLLVAALGQGIHAIPLIGPPLGDGITYLIASVQFIERILVG